MPASISQFGNEVAGENYVLRPGGYGVIHRDDGWLAVVVTPQGVFLPGGGQATGETAERALIRETAEECGLSIRILHQLGIADELVFGKEERRFYRKRCVFYSAEMTGECTTAKSETDHELKWLSPQDAIGRLSHRSQQWAVKAFLKSPSYQG